MRGERGARGGARPRGKEQREGRHVPRGPRPAALPRISIEKTPANDLHLLLNQVLPTADIVQFLKRPEAFFQKHRPELQFAKQLLENQLKELSTRLRVELAPQARPPQDAKEQRTASAAGKRAATSLARKRTSLLR